jgi:hypothetical protein
MRLTLHRAELHPLPLPELSSGHRWPSVLVALVAAALALGGGVLVLLVAIGG